MGQKVMILYGVKKLMAVNGYYFIQMDSKGAAERTSDECLGKLRAINNQRDRYILYDNGEAYDATKNPTNSRKEYGLFQFRYELCNVGNIRKMKILFPQIDNIPIKNKYDTNKTLKSNEGSDYVNDDSGSEEGGAHANKYRYKIIDL